MGMIEDSRILTAIDVGTSKVCTIIARTNGAKSLEILAHSVAPSEGLKKGNVVEIASTEKAVRASIQGAEQKSGLKIQTAYVGVTGAHVSFENRWDTLGWAGQRGVITADDLSRVQESVTPRTVGTGRKVIHAIPMAYSLDGQKGIRDPLGMHSRNLAVETHVVTGASSFIDKLVTAVESVKVKVAALVLEPLASSEAVLTPREREQGAVVVDIGGGTSDLAVFKNSSLFYTAVIPVGGYQFTNDISVTYNTPYAAAEDAKIKYAHTEPFEVLPDDEIRLPVLGGTTELKVLRRDICLLARERAQELVRLIKIKLQEAQLGEVSNVRLVLTGGTANLPGLATLAQRTLSNRVRIGVPNGRGDIPEELKTPSYSTGVGILLWAMNQDRPVAVHTTNGSGTSTETGAAATISRFFKQVRSLFTTHPFSAK